MVNLFAVRAAVDFLARLRRQCRRPQSQSGSPKWTFTSPSTLLATTSLMFALPPQLPKGADGQVCGIGCPECPGTLEVRVEGDHGYLHFFCRIGHSYSADDLLVGKEKAIEDRLWSAVLAFEEMAAILGDLDRHAAGHGWSDMRGAYQERQARLREQAQTLRQFAEINHPIRLKDPATVSDADGN